MFPEIEITIPRKSKSFIPNSILLLLAFATAFFPRVLVGAPAAINFVHFAIIPMTCGFVLLQSRTKDRKQIAIAQSFFLAIGALLAVITASAFLNNAGAINVILDFILLGEPFLLLLAIISIPMSEASQIRFRNGLMGFAIVNLLFAFFQAFVLRLNVIHKNGDYIEGVFIGQGSGHVVGGSVSMVFGVYYLVAVKNHPLWMRLSVMLAVLIHIVVSDTKQVLAIFLAALLIMIIFKVNNIGKLIQYLAIGVVFAGLILWSAFTVFHSLRTWANLDIQQQGFNLKLSAFSIIISHYHSPLNWLLGLGPGHTVGRLGGWMIEKYSGLLAPFGVTSTGIGARVWDVTAASWLGNKSSWFTPLFGWVGIWGDLGFLGLGSYLSLWWLVWQRLCHTDIPKFFVLTIICFGFILSQIEEPGYMMFMVSIIGLCWQEHRLHKIVERESAFNLTD
jgi:hypothetical protein